MRHLPGRLLAAAALPVTLLATAAPAQAEYEFGEPAQAAASWLAAQSDGASWNDQDVSTSLDAVIALEAAQVGADQVEATLQWLDDNAVLSAYVNPTPEGAGEPELNAGSAGKVMYAVATAGGDATNFGGIRLADELADAQAENGAYGDGSATSTAWAVLGLSRTDTPAGDEAAAGLAAVQCPDGGFNYADVDGGDDCVSDTDTTGLAVSALTTLGDAASGTLDEAVSWLEANQAEDGGFEYSTGYGENANSTAMAAQAFLAAGSTEQAESAIAYLLTLQYDCTGAEPGAIMYTDPETGDYVETSRLLATAQAIVPLANQSLATLDASDSTADVPGTGCESADSGDSASAAEASDSGSPSWPTWAIAAAVVVVVALIIGLALRTRRNGGAAAASDEEPKEDGPETGHSETEEAMTGEASADEPESGEPESGGSATDEPGADGSAADRPGDQDNKQ